MYKQVWKLHVTSLVHGKENVTFLIFSGNKLNINVQKVKQKKKDL